MEIEELSSIELRFCEGTSDKVYRASIETEDGGYVVNFAYGRRCATLNTGTKTAQPVMYDEAISIYEKLVRSKTVKGYQPIGNVVPSTGTGMIVTDREQRDTGLRPQLLNPVDDHMVEAYLVNDAWCAQEKFDGRRMLLRKEGSCIIAANRTGLSVGFPAGVAEALIRVDGDFVIDGESVGENFHVFDLLEDDSGDLRGAPYWERLQLLNRHFGQHAGPVKVVETVTGMAKRAFFDEMKAIDKEGVVFKSLNASWNVGRPASGGSAIKVKFWATCSCVVIKANGKRSVELALGGSSVGNVAIPLNHVVPEVGQIVEVRYLYVTAIGGSLYQPIYLGVRDDVQIEDCTVERQQIKYKPAA